MQLKANPLQCPQSNHCHAFSVKIQKNSDLVTTLHRALDTVDLCVIEQTALKNCIEQYNQRLKEINNE